MNYSDLDYLVSSSPEAKKELDWLRTELSMNLHLLVTSGERELKQLTLISDLKKQLAQWKSAAMRVGEKLDGTGPAGYYDFSPQEWEAWCRLRLEQLKN